VARLLLVLAGAAVGGCAQDPEPVAIAELGAELQESICDWAVRCAHAPDRATCERLLDPKSYDTRRAQDSVAAGRLAYDAAAAGACVAATAGAHCLATPFTDPACDRMFAGLIVEGGACTDGFECADNAQCLDTTCGDQCCSGTCGPPRPLTGQPPELAAIGEPCATHTDCEVGAYCETDGRCTPAPDQEGARCLFGCARGDLYCDVDDLQCKAWAGAGAACDPEGVAAPPCDPAWSFCDGVCRARPGAGEACDDASRFCIASTWCDGSVCRARGDGGESCLAPDQCTVTCSSAGECVEYQTCAT
jgi:hypothetical protein